LVEIFIVISTKKQENIWSLKGFWSFRDKIAQTAAVLYIKVIINSVILLMNVPFVAN